MIEALRRCQGYHACDPELRIALVLNRASPTELATCAPFVAEVYGVPYTSFGAPVGSPRRALQRVPRDWDYVVHHPAAFDPEEQRFEGLRRYYEAAGKHFRGRLRGRRRRRRRRPSTPRTSSSGSSCPSTSAKPPARSSTDAARSP